MKVAVSIPEPVFAAAEHEARRLCVSRSELYARALRSFVEQRQDDAITERLNRVYADEPGALDPRLRQMQTETVERAARRGAGRRRW